MYGESEGEEFRERLNNEWMGWLQLVAVLAEELGSTMENAWSRLFGNCAVLLA